MNEIDTSKFEALAVGRHGPLLEIAMSRPASKNAVDQTMHEELVDIFALAERDDTSRIILFTRVGNAFSASGDLACLEFMAATPGSCEESTRQAKAIIFSMLDMMKPVIARVTGDAIGLGAALALLSNEVVAAEDARIGDQHVRVGLAAGDGGAVIWPALIGYLKAKAAILTDKLFTAPEAARMGLSTETVPYEILVERVSKWARDLDASATMAVHYSKAAMNIGLRSDPARRSWKPLFDMRLLRPTPQITWKRSGRCGKSARLGLKKVEGEYMKTRSRRIPVWSCGSLNSVRIPRRRNRDAC